MLLLRFKKRIRHCYLFVVKANAHSDLVLFREDSFSCDVVIDVASLGMAREPRLLPTNSVVLCMMAAGNGHYHDFGDRGR